ncbi:hypothetical protein CVT25_013382 [Psilocybe cyanescens]|uniref:F-box domain-containing protein n=1 Tax=Psilocybe cyanescens TaxID=93625 RepID=A0A409VTD6_PSICY|nr:hypothetical protein CVT25_013382 [Psilocybe cyanescens]
MHLCLQVNEILDLILTDLFESRPGLQSKHDLISAALTCHDFLENALDILWKTQTSLVPLIKTLPRNRWRESQTNSSRFDLRFKTRTDKQAPLFPNLQRVKFATIDHASPCLDIFLETKQVSLSLNWSHTNDNVDSLIPIIEKHALNMQELDLGSFQDVERYSGSDSALSRLMCNMKDLLGLSCGPRILDAAAIEHLSSLPRLRKLHLPHDSQEILQGLNRKRHALRNPQPFPELQDLFIRESKLSSFTLLTKYMRPLQIRDLTLQLSNTFNARDIMQSFSALSEGSSQYGNIQKLTYKYIWLVNEPGTRTVNKEVVIGGDIMHPLLTLTNLTVLELDILCAFNLGDPEIMLMADTWTSAAGILVGMEDFFLHLLLRLPPSFIKMS